MHKLLAARSLHLMAVVVVESVESVELDNGKERVGKEKFLLDPEGTPDTQLLVLLNPVWSRLHTTRHGSSARNRWEQAGTAFAA